MTHSLAACVRALVRISTQSNFSHNLIKYHTLRTHAHTHWTPNRGVDAFSFSLLLKLLLVFHSILSKSHPFTTAMCSCHFFLFFLYSVFLHSLTLFFWQHSFRANCAPAFVDLLLLFRLRAIHSSEPFKWIYKLERVFVYVCVWKCDFAIETLCKRYSLTHSLKKQIWAIFSFVHANSTSVPHFRIRFLDRRFN